MESLKQKRPRAVSYTEEKTALLKANQMTDFHILLQTPLEAQDRTPPANIQRHVKPEKTHYN